MRHNSIEFSDPRTACGQLFLRLPPATGSQNRIMKHCFTLLELLVVCFIVVLIIGFAVPNLYNRIPVVAEKNEIRKLSRTITWTLNESVSTGIPLQVQYDLDNQKYWVNLVGKVDEETGKTERVYYTKLDNISIREIHFGDGDVLSTQSLVVDVHPQGYIDPHRIYLEDAEQERSWTLVVNPLTGTVHQYNYDYFPD